jgi:hypothetical protein
MALVANLLKNGIVRRAAHLYFATCVSPKQIERAQLFGGKQMDPSDVASIMMPDSNETDDEDISSGPEDL